MPQHNRNDQELAARNYHFSRDAVEKVLVITFLAKLHFCFMRLSTRRYTSSTSSACQV